MMRMVRIAQTKKKNRINSIVVEKKRFLLRKTNKPNGYYSIQILDK